MKLKTLFVIISAFLVACDVTPTPTAVRPYLVIVSTETPTYTPTSTVMPTSTPTIIPTATHTPVIKGNQCRTLDEYANIIAFDGVSEEEVVKIAEKCGIDRTDLLVEKDFKIHSTK